MPEKPSVRVDRPAAGLAVIVLDRPEKKNALSTALRIEGNALLAELAADEEVRALVVTGAGDAFCSGFDLDEFRTAADDEHRLARLWASADEWHRRWIEFPVPTIAAVNGPAIAGGFDVAVMCDLRVVAETASFGHPEISFGDVVYGPLHDLVGAAVARDLCFTGRRIDAREADRLGLCSRLVAVEHVVDEAVAVAERIARAPREVLVRTKAKAVRRARLTEEATLDL